MLSKDDWLFRLEEVESELARSRGVITNGKHRDRDIEALEKYRQWIKTKAMKAGAAGVPNRERLPT